MNGIKNMNKFKSISVSNGKVVDSSGNVVIELRNTNIKIAPKVCKSCNGTGLVKVMQVHGTNKVKKCNKCNGIGFNSLEVE